MTSTRLLSESRYFLVALVAAKESMTFAIYDIRYKLDLQFESENCM